MLVLKSPVTGPRDRPNLGSRARIEANNSSGSGLLAPHLAVDQLDVEPTLIQDRCARHAKLQIELFIAIFHVEFPDSFSVPGETCQIPGAKERPNVIAVGGR